jgi:hypothetical protein
MQITCGAHQHAPSSCGPDAITSMTCVLYDKNRIFVLNIQRCLVSLLLSLCSCDVMLLQKLFEENYILEQVNAINKLRNVSLVPSLRVLTLSMNVSEMSWIQDMSSSICNKLLFYNHNAPDKMYFHIRS